MTLRATACLFALAAVRAFAGEGSQDPDFERFPFTKWAAQGKHSEIPWSIDSVPAELSTFQRLIQRVFIKIDGREIAKRRGEGEMILLIEYRDEKGALWQSHTSMELESVDPAFGKADLQIAVYAFVLPGDYSLSLALYDTATKEHCFSVRKIHVGALKNDPLPEAWTGLPAVEFVDQEQDVPAAWYLPGLRSRLNLPVANRRPVHVDLLLNTTPSDRSSGSTVVLRRNMSILIPFLRILTQMQLRQGSMSVTLLDLTRQRAVPVHGWEGIKDFFADAKPGMIDVHALEAQNRMQSFFLDQVNRRLNAPGDDARVTIVLSGPAFMQGQEPPAPVSSPSESNRQLFYVRYRPGPLRQRLRVNDGRVVFPPPTILPLPVDQLERAVEPLHANLYDATSMLEFRQALASILERISRFQGPQSLP